MYRWRERWRTPSGPLASETPGHFSPNRDFSEVPRLKHPFISSDLYHTSATISHRRRSQSNLLERLGSPPSSYIAVALPPRTITLRGSFCIPQQPDIANSLRTLSSTTESSRQSRLSASKAPHLAGEVIGISSTSCLCIPLLRSSSALYTRWCLQSGSILPSSHLISSSSCLLTRPFPSFCSSFSS